MADDSCRSCSSQRPWVMTGMRPILGRSCQREDCLKPAFCEVSRRAAITPLELAPASFEDEQQILRLDIVARCD